MGAGKPAGVYLGSHSVRNGELQRQGGVLAPGMFSA